MATYYLEYGLLRNPSIDDLAEAIRAHQMTEESGFINLDEDGRSGVMVGRGEAHLKAINEDQTALVDKTEETWSEIPFWLVEKEEGQSLVINRGNLKSSIRMLTGLFSEAMEQEVMLEEIPFDPVAAAVKMSMVVGNFGIKRVSLSDYAVDSETEGPYRPEFGSTQRALDFLEEQEEEVVSIRLGWKMDTGNNVSLTLGRTCRFAYSCSETDEEPQVRKVIELLALSPTLLQEREAGPLFEDANPESEAQEEDDD